MNKGQDIVEYALISFMVLLIVLVFAIVIWAITAPPPAVCDKSKPTAQDIVLCIGTVTAEARNR